jgi:hypothetical protein
MLVLGSCTVNHQGFWFHKFFVWSHSSFGLIVLLLLSTSYYWISSSSPVALLVWFDHHGVAVESRTTACRVTTDRITRADLNCRRSVPVLEELSFSKSIIRGNHAGDQECFIIFSPVDWKCSKKCRCTTTTVGIPSSLCARTSSYWVGRSWGNPDIGKPFRCRAGWNCY